MAMPRYLVVLGLLALVIVVMGSISVVGAQVMCTGNTEQGQPGDVGPDGEHAQEADAAAQSGFRRGGPAKLQFCGCAS